MENEPDKTADEKWLKDLPLRSENIGFQPEEMKTCPKCGKANPPTRPACFYCLAGLEIAESADNIGKLERRVLETWENGFNIIYLPGLSMLRTPDISLIARYLSVEADLLKSVLECESPMPIARLESETEAAAAVELLSNAGLVCRTVSDAALRADKLPVRLRALEFRDGCLILTVFNTNEKREVPTHEILLIVTGTIFESKTETVEKRKKKEQKILFETQTSNDGALIDIYTKDEPNGYRISIKGFDFSCLGAEMGLVAGENIGRLIAVLKNWASEAKFVSDYNAARELLDTIWETERRKDTSGLQPAGFGGAEVIKIESSNNLQQFTKYSRLQRNLL